MAYVCVWEGKSYGSRRVNLKVGTLHPTTGKVLTPEDDCNPEINALKEKALTTPDKLSKQEKANFCWYVESMNPEQLGDREAFDVEHDDKSRIKKIPTNVDESGNHVPHRYSKQNLAAVYEKLSGKPLATDNIHKFGARKIRR